MHALLFDTLHYASKLEQAGVPRLQAEAQAYALAEIVDERLATKEDLKKMEAKIESKFDSKLSNLKVELIKWMLSISLGVSAAQATILISCMKFIH